MPVPSVEGQPMKLTDMARQLRLDVLALTTAWGGHLSSCLSAVDIMTAVYFGDVMTYRPKEAKWPKRDRFILSKGHAAPLLYSVLARAGYYPVEELSRFRQLDQPFHGHPIQDSVPGVEMTSGSLGQGLSFGLGHVLAGRMEGLNYRVYVLLGDGECQAGQIWEAAMAAAHYKADHLTAIVDYNKYQQTGPISREMALEPFVAKWNSFGWEACEVDGHDPHAVVAALRKMAQVKGKPTIVIAHTVKGKGIPTVEKDYTFHGRGLSPEEAAKARQIILDTVQ